MGTVALWLVAASAAGATHNQFLRTSFVGVDAVVVALVGDEGDHKGRSYGELPRNLRPSALEVGPRHVLAAPFQGGQIGAEVSYERGAVTSSARYAA
jgi:hypothetical protein